MFPTQPPHSPSRGSEQSAEPILNHAPRHRRPRLLPPPPPPPQQRYAQCPSSSLRVPSCASCSSCCAMTTRAPRSLLPQRDEKTPRHCRAHRVRAPLRPPATCARAGPPHCRRRSAGAARAGELGASVRTPARPSRRSARPRSCAHHRRRSATLRARDSQSRAQARQS